MALIVVMEDHPPMALRGAIALFGAPVAIHLDKLERAGMEVIAEAKDTSR